MGPAGVGSERRRSGTQSAGSVMLEVDIRESTTLKGGAKGAEGGKDNSKSENENKYLITKLIKSV